MEKREINFQISPPPKKMVLSLLVAELELSLLPNHQRWCAKMEAQLEYARIAYMFFNAWHRFACSVANY